MRSQRRHLVPISGWIVALAAVLVLDVVGLALGRVLRGRRRRPGADATKSEPS
jgi:uncharacterized protein YqfA (UPF0365 family)